jgi:LacI family transcriptional regulator
MSLSIRQIAELAGVSRGTVDRALNGRGEINTGVRQRILQIAEENGFRSNRAGKMLGIRKKPMKIGIQIPSEGNDFFADVQAGIHQAAAELADFGLSIMTRTMKGFSAGTQVAQIQKMLDDGIHALAFAPIDHSDVKTLLAGLDKRSLPVMTFNTDIDAPHLGYVGNDYRRSGAIAAGILAVAAGGRPFRTLVVTGSAQVLGHNQRVAGFSEVIRRRCPEIMILEILENQDDEDISHHLLREALVRHPDLDAVFLAAGGVAGACRALQEHAEDRNGGQRAQVICFDQPPGTMTFLKSGLITASIGQEPFRQGYLPVRYLFDYLLDGTKPPRYTLTRNEIIIREHMDFTDLPGDSRQDGIQNFYRDKDQVKLK